MHKLSKITKNICLGFIYVTIQAAPEFAFQYNFPDSINYIIGAHHWLPPHDGRNAELKTTMRLKTTTPKIRWLHDGKVDSSIVMAIDLKGRRNLQVEDDYDVYFKFLPDGMTGELTESIAGKWQAEALDPSETSVLYRSSIVHISPLKNMPFKKHKVQPIYTLWPSNNDTGKPYYTYVKSSAFSFKPDFVCKYVDHNGIIHTVTQNNKWAPDHSFPVASLVFFYSVENGMPYLWPKIFPFSERTGTGSGDTDEDFYNPIITNQPRSQTVQAGSNVSLTVTAEPGFSASSLQYQWKKNDVNIFGATNRIYNINNAVNSDAGNYSVVVINDITSVASSIATLTVNIPAVAPTIITQPVSQTASLGGSVTFNAVASGTAPLTYQWFKDGAQISGASSDSLKISNLMTSSSGKYMVKISNQSGNTTSSIVTLTINIPAAPPTITTQPVSKTASLGGSVTFNVVASGTAPLTYQWFKKISPELSSQISGAVGSSLTITNIKTTDSGIYVVLVSNAISSVYSNAANLSISRPNLSNLSVRTALGANQIVIVGVTMSGGSKNVLLRAVGPTLSAFGVPSVMADPKLDLYSGSTKVTTNDNWGGSTTLSSAFQSVGAFAYSSTTSLDSALMTSIDGGRTVQVSGPTAGTVLVEGYDTGDGNFQRFTNLSARNKVGTGANILIAGFTLTGTGTRNLLIRAVGPKLSDFGVSNVLTDPKLEIYSGTTKLTENDNWSSSLATTFFGVGAFGLNTGSKDSAITVSLPAGGYTVQVSGADGGVGEAIVEIYELP